MSTPSNIAIKYTDEIYATKNQIRKISGMILFDSYWDEISTYRENHKVILPFGKINSHPYFITLTDPIKAKISIFQNTIKEFLTLTRSFLLDNTRKDSQLILLTPLLEDAAAFEKSTINDLSIKMLINSLYSENNISHAPIVNYCSALKYYLDASSLPPNDDFLAGAYQRLLGQEELTDFYRWNDFGMEGKISFMRYVAEPEYPFAPYEMIDDLMETFLSWLDEEDNIPYFAKAVLSAYYINYIKPFKEKNSLIASLLAKDVVSYSTGFQEAFVLPFENILKNDFNNTEAIKEAKSKGDMTYLVLEAISNLNLYIDNVTSQLKKLRISPYKEDFTKLSKEEEQIAEKIEDKNTFKEPTQLSFFDNIPEEEPKKEEKVEISQVEPPKEKENNPKPSLIQEKAPEIEKESKEETKSTKKIDSLVIDSTSKETEVLSKSEIKDYIRYLLETNPNLNKKQASFLANHNTPGRYYTIQQFKDHAHCVYETARTSMDKLASEGYYEKLQFKNKFVYSPKKKGN